MVTLQDVVVDLLTPQVRSAFHGEKVWLHSRNVPVAEIVAWLELQTQRFHIFLPAMLFVSFNHNVLLLATLLSFLGTPIFP